MSYGLVRGLNLIKVEHVSIPNVLAGRALVPEFLQGDAQPAMMGAALYRLLTSPAARLDQTSAFETLHAQLAQNADARAARAIVELI
jgi:lipid-A-disaccharide synthase